MYVFIVNPIAGNGKAKKIYRRLMKHELYKQLNPVCHFTKYKGHAAELAAQACHAKVIVVIGGDGTMHEVVNGLEGRQISIAFIPGGSGNDFARGFDSFKDPFEVLFSLLDEKQEKEYWAGNFQTEDGAKRQFLNCIGVGFDAVVTASANRSRLKEAFGSIRLGSIVYIFALLRELFFYRPINLAIETEEGRKTFSRCFLATINNHPYFGGGMKINPLASNQPNYFSVLAIDSISKWKVLALFLTVFSGKHLNYKEVHTFKAKRLTIHADGPIPFQADGEAGEALHFSISKEPSSIKIKGFQVDNARRSS